MSSVLVSINWPSRECRDSGRKDDPLGAERREAHKMPGTRWSWTTQHPSYPDSLWNHLKHAKELAVGQVDLLTAVAGLGDWYRPRSRRGGRIQASLRWSQLRSYLWEGAVSRRRKMLLYLQHQMILKGASEDFTKLVGSTDGAKVISHREC